MFGNVAFAMEIMGRSRKEIRDKVEAALSLMGLSRKADEYPRNLSGGEQQRVALARAIVNTPRILIADEPTGNLDPANAEQIMNLLDLINSQGTTVIVATHAQDMARRMGRRILYLDHGVKNEDLSAPDAQSGEESVLKSIAFEAEGSLFTEDGAAEKGGEGDE